MWENAYLSIKNPKAVADPGFSPGGCANSQKCYYFSIFFPKLHENERIRTPRGVCISHPNLGDERHSEVHVVF